MNPSPSTLKKTTSRTAKASTGTPATQSTSLLKIPMSEQRPVAVRFATINARDNFVPREWRHEPLSPDAESGWYSLDINAFNLTDGVYEYEFVIGGDDDHPVADPYAGEITRFGGYRGIFRIKDGKKFTPEFRWNEELNRDKPLQNNHR
ncbi:MAG: hypothetical protein JW863_17465 [Chitinispirillaceae bacterium]|nr:hypothetical protein [Chitinispirillaceae bacterium]